MAGRASGATVVTLALVLAAGLVLAGRHVMLESTRTWDFNAVRLQRSFVLAAGGNIYPGVDSGAVLNAIYGPIGTVAYLPAAWFRSPVDAVLAGQLLSLLFVLVPPLVLHLRAAGRAPGALASAVFGWLLFAALAFALRPLVCAASTIHVDAPALALALAAWAVLTGGGPARLSTPRLVLTSGLAALAVWTKLPVLPLLAAVPLWVLLVEGRRGAVRAVFVLAFVVVAVTAGLAVVFGPPENLLLNVWTVPMRHTVEGAATAMAWLVGFLQFGSATGAIWLLVALFAFGRHRIRRASAAPWRSWTRDALLVYGLPVILLLPLAFLSLIKRGGDVNALSYPVYFLVTGFTLALAAEGRRTRWGRRLALGLPACAVAVLLFVQLPESLTSWRQPLERAALPQQIAYDYARAHPGRVYFPRLTLATLLAEGEIYHQSVGLYDRSLAGFSPRREHLLAHLPRHLDGIAYYDNTFSTRLLGPAAGRPLPPDLRAIELPELGCLSTDPELPGFVVRRRCPGSGRGEVPPGV